MAEQTDRYCAIGRGEERARKNVRRRRRIDKICQTDSGALLVQRRHGTIYRYVCGYKNTGRNGRMSASAYILDCKPGLSECTSSSNYCISTDHAAVTS